MNDAQMALADRAFDRVATNGTMNFWGFVRAVGWLLEQDFQNVKNPPPKPKYEGALEQACRPYGQQGGQK